MQSARYSTKEQLARHDRDKILRQHMGEAAVPQVGRMRLRSANAQIVHIQLPGLERQMSIGANNNAQSSGCNDMHADTVLQPVRLNETLAYTTR